MFLADHDKIKTYPPDKLLSFHRYSSNIQVADSSVEAN